MPHALSSYALAGTACYRSAGSASAAVVELAAEEIGAWGLLNASFTRLAVDPCNTAVLHTAIASRP